jgi:integrase
LLVEPAAISLNEYLDKWLTNAARPRLRERTFTDYLELLSRYVRPSLGRKKLSDVRLLDIQILYTKLQECGLSARTVRYTHAVLSSALKQAVKWRMLSQNPASVLELSRACRKEMRSLSAEDAAHFLAVAEQDHWGAIFALALATGMRPEEYLALQWKDVDFDKGVVTVQRALVRSRKGGGWTFTEPKTTRSRRSIPLPKSIVHALIIHRRRQAEERLRAGASYNNIDLIFATRAGTPLSHRNLLSRHFKPILRRAGLADSIRLYDLRHTCATLLLAENEHPKVVSERLGHASITLTLDTYSLLWSLQQLS